jgi:hypothetical protein
LAYLGFCRVATQRLARAGSNVASRRRKGLGEGRERLRVPLRYPGGAQLGANAMSLPVTLSAGDHLLTENAVDWKVTFMDSIPPGVMLTASIAGGPNPPPFPGQGTAATTLAIQMDARVAIALYPLHGLAAASRSRTPSLRAFKRRFGVSNSAPPRADRTIARAGFCSILVAMW